MSDLILVLNCGSSSIKFALFDGGRVRFNRMPLWNGKVNGITGPCPTFDETGIAPSPIALDPSAPYHEALTHIAKRVQARRGDHRIRAIAHRVVHGGSRYFQPTLVNAEVLADLRSFIPLAPLHQPFALEAIERLLEERPELPQVACFDTGFHHTLPRVEQMLPISWEAWERGIRRYGFHGLSYEYQSIALADRYGDRARGRTIVAHLGSGASLCGMRDLRSVATTMGFSALDGLMMGTRTGALDPGALLYLMEIEKIPLHDVGQLLYHKSGLLGLSGISSDPRVLLDREATEPRARDALALYVRRIVRELGAMTAALGGLDLLAFTAGVGEHNTILRERICQDLSFMGIELDPEANSSHGAVISTQQSSILIAVEPTNEEWIAALRANDLIGNPDVAGIGNPSQDA
ncbi:acetate/propionate family kinase [Microvirga mediterraneensis]|uniref:Acetate kinase n=1 Tax=Microvirga mediterraneensis TaxID=2754695 RepID=A0A838BTC1_9HYPH|nr:acetate/propionate family kinase [Microvirga mediterraneensis]MBA1159084.1 acetate/propionate family kinase [Microvirga mediterraneensis]